MGSEFVISWCQVCELEFLVSGREEERAESWEEWYSGQGDSLLNGVREGN